MRHIRVLVGAAILIALDFVGEWLAKLAHAAVPGSVIGMLLLVALVQARILPVGLIRDTAGFLIRHLALLLVPAGAGILLYGGALRDSVLAIAAAAVLSLVSVLLVVGLVAERALREP